MSVSVGRRCSHGEQNDCEYGCHVSAEDLRLADEIDRAADNVWDRPRLARLLRTHDLSAEDLSEEFGIPVKGASAKKMIHRARRDARKMAS